MAVAAREGIDLLFNTDTASGKTNELVGDPHVNIGFLKESTVRPLSYMLCYLKLIWVFSSFLVIDGHCKGTTPTG